MTGEKVTSFRNDDESAKGITGEVCDKEDYVSCLFSADCCNKFEQYSIIAAELRVLTSTIDIKIMRAKDYPRRPDW